METFNTFADRMKNMGVMNYLKVRECRLCEFILTVLIFKRNHLSDEVGNDVKGMEKGQDTWIDTRG